MNNIRPKHILLVGCGNMGSALLRSWQSSLKDTQFAILDPAPPKDEFKKHIHGASIAELIEFLQNTDIVVFAVKPQIIDTVCADLAPHTPKSTLILSIAAGTPISFFENHFGNDQPIIRTMPNTPAAIGKAITVAVANTHATDKQKSQATALLKAVGLVEWIDDENLLNAVTALSGSGPAYIFYLIESLTKAGENIGLPAGLSERLARQTVIGSAALAEHNSEIPAATLRNNVTSPGGTTEAALKILRNGELDTLLERALNAAKKRGTELGS